MKSIFLLFLLAFTHSSFSKDLGNGNFDGEIETRRCNEHGEVFMYQITAKLSKNEYEIRSLNVLPKYSVAILKSKTEFSGTGRVGGPMMITGTKKVTLTNGFEKELYVWEACSDSHKESGKKGKSANCQDACWKKEDKHLFKGAETLEKCLIKACE